LKNLRAVSAFTGEDAKAAKARSKAMADELAVRDKLAEMGPEAKEKFERAVELLGPDMGKALQQMFLTGGAVVDKSLAITLAQSPTQKALLDKVFADLSNQSVSTKETVANYQASVKDNAEALKIEKSNIAKGIGVTAALTGKYSDVARMGAGIDDLANKGLALREAEVAAIGNTVEQMQRLSTNVDKLKNVIDPLRESIVQAEQVTRTKLPEQINTLTGAMAMFVDKLGPKGLAGVMDQQFKLQEKYMKMYLGLVAEGPKLQTGGKVAELSAKAGEVFLGVVNKFSGAVDRFSQSVGGGGGKGGKPQGYNKGTLGVHGQYFHDFGLRTLAELHGPQAVMTPNQFTDLVKNAQAGVLKDLASTTSTDSAASAESAKMSDTVTSTLSTLATQITNSNQAQIGKLDELISTMRDKTIWEDMLRATEDTAENTRKMTNALA
jgi:hypothetical protein